VPNRPSPRPSVAPIPQNPSVICSPLLDCISVAREFPWAAGTAPPSGLEAVVQASHYFSNRDRHTALPVYCTKFREALQSRIAGTVGEPVHPELFPRNMGHDSDGRRILDCDEDKKQAAAGRLQHTLYNILSFFGRES